MKRHLLSFRSSPPELVEALFRFRAEHPPKGAHVGGVRWTYLETGQGPDTVLLLPGATGHAELSWRTISHLEARHRVIAPDYPALDSMSALADGLAELLAARGVERAHVLGGSYGGLVAQAFIRRHPGRTMSLVLAYTVLPDPTSTAKMARSLRWLERLPEGLLRGLLRLRLASLFPRGAAGEIAFTKAHLAELSSGLGKADLLALMRRVSDLGASFQFTSRDLDAWPGRILLVLASDDPATPEPARRALHAMYARAEVKIHSGGGHLTALVKQEEYFTFLDDFLAGKG